jgi:hypothetical protein
MMPLSQALASSKSMVRVNSDMVNAVAFGLNGHDRYSGALLSLALRHLDTMTDLMAPVAKRWPSAFALSRVAADAALRAVYLGFGEIAPNFARRYKAFTEDKPNPFGGPKDLLGEVREAFNAHPLFASWGGTNPQGDETILRHLEVDWGSLSSFTHSGEIQARFALHEVRTGEAPHEYIRTTALFATTRAVTECVGIVLAQRGEPQRGGFVAIEFEKAFPPDQVTDVYDGPPSRS